MHTPAAARYGSSSTGFLRHAAERCSTNASGRAAAIVSKANTAAGGLQTRVERVTFTNVPAFVLHPGVPVQVGPRHLRVDVAYGGAFYAIVDAEAAGLAIDVAHLPELRRVGIAIREAVERVVTVAHPLQPSFGG